MICTTVLLVSYSTSLPYSKAILMTPSSVISAQVSMVGLRKSGRCRSNLATLQILAKPDATCGRFAKPNWIWFNHHPRGRNLLDIRARRLLKCDCQLPCCVYSLTLFRIIFLKKSVYIHFMLRVTISWIRLSLPSCLHFLLTSLLFTVSTS